MNKVKKEVRRRNKPNKTVGGSELFRVLGCRGTPAGDIFREAEDPESTFLKEGVLELIFKVKNNGSSALEVRMTEMRVGGSLIRTPFWSTAG